VITMPTKKANIVFSHVEDFVNGIHTGDLVLNPKAQNIMLDKTTGKGVLGRRSKEKRSLADLIGEGLFQYQSIRNSVSNFESMQQQFSQIDWVNMNIAIGRRLEDVASYLLKYIEQAYAHNVVDNVGIGKRLNECQQNNEKFKERIDELEKDNQKLHNELKKWGKVGYVSDLEKTDRE